MARGIPGQGTRFRLFPQVPFLPQVMGPETVWLSPAPWTIRPGPSDDRFYVVDPVYKPDAYRFPYLPPYREAIHPPVQPGPGGHFDHLPIHSREFRAAHLYGSARLLLDIWEAYLGHRLRFHFERDFPRMELVPLPHWDNAHSGYGFIETGHGEAEDGERHHYSLNFDVIAHEFGHSVIYAEVGIPSQSGRTAEYFGFHESAGDLVALLSSLHFDSNLDGLLARTSGNLYTLNELNRIAELSETEQIRMACNDLTMADYANGITTEHKLSLPLTGAVFDILVAIFQDLLWQRGLIDAELRLQCDRTPEAINLDVVQARFDAAYAGRHGQFRDALMIARDYLGLCLARCWTQLSAENLHYEDVGATLLAVERWLGGGYQKTVLDCLLWRQIGHVTVGAQLKRDVASGDRQCRID